MPKKDKSNIKKEKPKKHKSKSPVKKKKVQSSLSDTDLKLLREGKHYKSYERLGAFVKTVKKIKGVQFTVWAPNAKAVSVVGEFNDWKDGIDKMEKTGNNPDTGVFSFPD